MSLALTTAPASVNLAKNPVFVKFQSSGHTGLDNYRVVLRVLFENNYESSTYTQIVEIEAIPDSNAETTFDISDILQRAMERTMTFKVPDIATPLPYLSDTLRRFKIQYLEKYGTPQVEQTATTSTTYKAHYGGVDSHYFGLFDFFSNITTTNAILSYMPDGKTIGRDQPEYLNYLHHSSAISRHAYLRVNEYDNTGTLLSTSDKYRVLDGFTDPIFPDQWQACVFPTDPTTLAIDSNAVKYTVQVFHIQTLGSPGSYSETGTETQGSQTYTYYIDDTLRLSPKTIIWYGGFNNPHILRCTGKKRARLAIDRILSEQVVPHGYDPTTLASVQHDRSFNTHTIYRSGEISPEQKDALSELLIENKILEYTTEGNYYRLLVDGSTFDVYEEQQSPNYLEFTAVRALAPRNYMRLRSATTGAPTEQQWLTTDNGYWELNSGGGHWQLN